MDWRDGDLVCAEQPEFQERRDQMDSRQELVGSLRVVPLDHPIMDEAAFLPGAVTRPAIGSHSGAGSHAARDKPAQGLGGGVGGDQGHSHASQGPSAFLVGR